MATHHTPSHAAPPPPPFNKDQDDRDAAELTCLGFDEPAVDYLLVTTINKSATIPTYGALLRRLGPNVMKQYSYLLPELTGAKTFERRVDRWRQHPEKVEASAAAPSTMDGRDIWHNLLKSVEGKGAQAHLSGSKGKWVESLSCDEEEEPPAAAADKTGHKVAAEEESPPPRPPQARPPLLLVRPQEKAARPPAQAPPSDCLLF